MLRKLFLYAFALVFITGASLLVLLPATSVLAVHPLVSTAPTPDATAVFNAANDAVSHAQDILNIVNIFAAILGVVLTFFSLVAAGLAVLGVRSYREVLSLAQEFRTNMTEIRNEADKTREALVYLGIGDRLMSHQEKLEALENYKKAGNLLPTDAQLQYVLGRIYSGAGDYEAAIAALEASHPQQDIDQAKVQKELGLAYRRRGHELNNKDDFDKAIQCLKQSIKLNACDSDALAILGGLYRRQNDYKQAFQAYEQAWRADPASSYALSNLASLSWYQNKLDEARMYFNYTEVASASRIKQGQSEIFWPYYDLALAQLALGKTTEAKQTYTQAIKETPGKVPLEGVLHTLHLLQTASQSIVGLNDVVQMIEDARSGL